MSKTFVEVEQHRVQTIYDQVKVPYDWKLWKFDMGYDEWLEKTIHLKSDVFKFMSTDYDIDSQTIKGEALVHPDIYASLA